MIRLILIVAAVMICAIIAINLGKAQAAATRCTSSKVGSNLNTTCRGDEPRDCRTSKVGSNLITRCR